MGQRKPASFALSFTASIAVHAIACSGLIIYQHQQARPAIQQALVAPKLVTEDFNEDEIKVGDHVTKGDGIDSNEDDQPQTARESTQDQSWQSFDPAGHNEPFSSPVAMAADNQSVLNPPQPAASVADASFITGTRIAPPQTNKATKPQPKEETKASENKPQEQTPKAQQASASQTQSQTQTLAGDPAPQSDRHVDLFAKEASAVVKKGKVVSQEGRQIKMAKPVWTLAGYWDVVPLPVHLAVEITIEPTGKPRLVTIKHSTGSESIDRALLLAIYDSWFEPPTNPQKEPQSDTFVFTISVR